jgi:hypothetical protein
MQYGHWPSLEQLKCSKERKEVKQPAKKKYKRKSKNRIKSVPSEAFATFRYSAHSVPKATNLFNNAWEKGRIRA